MVVEVNMHKVWIIARNEIQMAMRNKGYWFLLLALPALAIYLIGLGAQGIARVVPTRIRIDVLDREGSTASQAFVAALAEANETLLVCPACNDPADPCALEGAFLSSELARERLADEITFAVITIPQGFASALEAGDEAALIFQPGAALAAPEMVFATVQNVVTRVGGPIVAAQLSTQMAESLGLETGPAFYAARYADADASWEPPLPVQVTAQMTQPDAGVSMGFQLMENGFKLSATSIAAMFVMISILGMTQSLAEERMMGVLGRVGMMPVGATQWLGGKLLGTFVMGSLQFGVLLAFGNVLGVEFGDAPLAALLTALAYVLAVAAMAMAIGTLARTPSQASALATFAWLVLVPLGGGWWPLVFVPEWMQRLGRLSPVAWCLDALNALVFYQGTLADVIQPVVVLLLFAVGFFVFGVKKFTFDRSGKADASQEAPDFGIWRDVRSDPHGE
jgi:ABC-2 type transport system permease protein